MSNQIAIQDGAELAARARAIATQPCLAELSDPINALAHALETGERLEAWTELDLLHVIDDEVIDCTGARSKQPLRRLIAFLDLIRVPLIFLPIALTWLAVGQAATKYNGGPESTPFIDQWQNGFSGNAPGWERLSSIATIDMLLILLVFGLTGMCLFFRNRFELEDLADEATHRRELRALLVDISVALAEVSLSSPLRFRHELNSMATELRESAESATALTSASALAVGGMAEATASLAEVAQTGALRTEELLAAVGQLQVEFATLRSENAAVTSGLGAVTTSLEGVSQDSVRLVGALTSAADEQATLLTQIRESMTMLDQQRTDMISLTNNHAAALSNERTSYQTVIGDLQKAASELGTPMAGLSALVSNLERALQGISADYVAFTTGLGTVTASLEGVSTDSSRLVGVLTKSSTEQESLLAQIRDSMALLDQQRTDLTALTTSHASDLSSERNSYRTVIGDLQKAASDLATPMAGLGRLVSELDRSLQGIGSVADSIPRATTDLVENLRGVGEEQIQVAQQLRDIARDLGRIQPAIGVAIAQTRDDLESLRQTIAKTVRP